ncbi:MAG: hypothetical protein ABR591_06805 [Candidatus Velthaea sp.]
MFSLTLAACAGGGSKAAPPVDATVKTAATMSTTTVAATSTTNSSQVTTFALPTVGSGYSGKLIVTFKQIGRGAQVRVGFIVPATIGACPSIPLISLENTSTSDITMFVDSLTIDTPCSIQNTLFGTSSFQLQPQPALVQPLKIFDATGAASEVAFGQSPVLITLPASTTTAMAVLPEINKFEVALPVAPGSTTALTSNPASLSSDVSTTPTGLSFDYSTVQGGSIFSSSCFPVTDPQTGLTNPMLAGTPLVGRPSFFCHFNPGNATLVFGNVVKFFIGTPKPDVSVLGLDGPTTTFICGAATTNTECDTSSFTIDNTSPTAFQNVVVGNADDLRECVPATPNTDCNALTSPAPATTSVPSNANFELLVADDPSYRPGAGPWSGVFTAAIATPSVCAFVTSPSATIGTPPNYTLASPQGNGPNAEFVINPLKRGTCTISMSEDPKFINVNPLNPTGRSVQLSVSIVKPNS